MLLCLLWMVFESAWADYLTLLGAKGGGVGISTVMIVEGHLNSISLSCLCIKQSLV
jgi:hypothetical protein